MAARAASAMPVIKRVAKNISLRIRAEPDPLGYSLLNLWQSHLGDGDCGAQSQRHAAQRFLVPGPLLRRLAFELLHPERDRVWWHTRQILENVWLGNSVRPLERM